MSNQGLGSWIDRRRIKSAEATALVFGENILTYADLAERIDRLANALAERGVAAGSRVAYLGENHPAFLETLFAVANLGAIFVPLNSRLAAPEINFALADSGARVLIHAQALSVLAVGGAADSAVDHRIVIGEKGEEPLQVVPDTHDVWPETFDDIVAEASAERQAAEVSLDDPAMILYTSGTTGRPKGALLTHGNLTWNCFNVIVDYDIVSTDVSIMISPMFHVASLGMGVLPTLLKGGTVVLEPRFDPARTLALIAQHRATMISGVPTTFQMLCEHPDWETTDISSLHKLTCGGSPVPLRVLESYEERGLAFSGGYGMTETSPGATSLAPARSRDKAGSAGLPHFFTELRIVGDDGSLVDVGTVGEIQLRGPNVIAEYWHRPEASQDAHADGEWFRSGDLGYLDADGYLFIADRLKDMIISGGENIYPAEIEQLIGTLDAVSAVAVIGLPDETWGEVPCAVVTLRPGAQLELADIRSLLEGRLARYKIPKRLVVIEELPRTASGKVRKADLRARYASG